MNTFYKYLFSAIFLISALSETNAQSTNREWWNSLSPAWKKVIQKQHFKGKDVTPTDEQLTEIGKMVFLDIENNKQIESLKPAEALQLLEIIKAKNSGLKSLEGIEGLINLKEIDCSDNDNINSLIPLSGLTNLEKINCGNTMVKSLVPLRYLDKLRNLDVHYTTIVDLRILKDLKNLTDLDVSQNISLFSLEGLNYMPELSSLNCSETNIDDLTPLSKLKNLQRLDCSKTKVSSLRPLQLVKSLQDIDCSDTQIKAKSLDYLIGLPNLIMLRAKNINISEDEVKEFETLLQKRNPDATIIIIPKKK
ncbi:MAG: leucine-rich repeat domain-containing protein [Chlorobi bacterium]|nr:leucine-rich repeat domain-containing protein [Chlorobiota bacterium]